MALFWSKKPKAEKNFAAEAKKGKTAGSTGAKKSGTKVAAKKAETKAVAAPAVQSFTDHADVIIRPLVTEKSGILSQSGVYTFEVSRTATKSTIAKAAKTLYKVTAEKVAVMNAPSRSVWVKGKWGTTSGFRKALITVKKGEKIDFV